jgi:hypothetical protein
MEVIMTKQEEYQKAQRERIETRGKVEQAIIKLERERLEAIKELEQINNQMSFSHTLLYLGETPKEGIEGIKAKKVELQSFINEKYPQIKKGLERLRIMGYPKAPPTTQDN